MYKKKRYYGKKRKKSTANSGVVHRVKTPRNNEILGEVLSLLGGGRMLVSCVDKKERICRIPGRIRRKMWVKEGDIVLTQPWSVESEKRGDVLWRYSPMDAEWLKRKGYLKIQEQEEQKEK